MRQCPPDLSSYWTITADGSGEVLAGGPGSSCCEDTGDGVTVYDVDGDSENDESVTAVVVSEDVQATVTISTLSVSGLAWYLSTGQDTQGPTPDGDGQGVRSGDNGWDACGFGSMYDRSYMLHVNTGSQRPWEVRWQIDDGSNFQGPMRPVTNPTPKPPQSHHPKF